MPKDLCAVASTSLTRPALFRGRRSARPDAFAMLAVLLICGIVWTTEGVTACANRTYALTACMNKLAPLFEVAGRGLPTSKAELHASCSAFKTGMACMDEYAKCVGEKGIQMIQEQAQGAVLLFRFLCDDPGFQSEYMKYTGCYKAISRDWAVCTDKFLAIAQEEISNHDGDSKLLASCCAKRGFLGCVYGSSRAHCQRHEALFLLRIAETISDIRVPVPVCQKIWPEACKACVSRLCLPAALALLLMLLTRALCTGP